MNLTFEMFMPTVWLFAALVMALSADYMVQRVARELANLKRYPMRSVHIEPRFLTT